MGNSNIQRFFTGSATVYVFWLAVVMFFVSFGALYFFTTVVPERMKQDAEGGPLRDFVTQVCMNTPGCLGAQARVIFENRHYSLLMDSAGTHTLAAETQAMHQVWDRTRSTLPWYERVLVTEVKRGAFVRSVRDKKKPAGRKE